MCYAWDKLIQTNHRHNLCFKGKDQTRKGNSAHCKGQNSSALDSTGKGICPRCFFQMGGTKCIYCWCYVFIPNVFYKRVFTLRDPYIASRLHHSPLIDPQESQSALRLADLTSEDEERLHGRISQYERTIDSLMTEVSSLKNEVSLHELTVYCTVFVHIVQYIDHLLLSTTNTICIWLDSCLLLYW